MARLKSVLVLFFLLHIMAAFSIFSRLIYGEWDGKGGDKISQTLNLLLMAASVALFIMGLKRLRSILPGFGLALALLTLIVCSIAWSVDPAESFRRAVLYVMVVLGAAGIAGAFEAEEILSLLLVACAISAVASLVAYVATPVMARMAETGDMRGVFPHKNVIGPAMAIGALVTCHQLSGKHVGRAAYLGLMALFTICAILSHSATSLLTIFTYGIATGLFSLFRNPRYRQMGIILTVLAVPLLVVCAATKDTLLVMFGKDPTLTGRTVLWGFVESNISLKPLFGWGFSAFWQPDNPPAQFISLTLGWVVPQAHNAILEMLLQLGFVGAAFFVALWLRNILISVKCFSTPAQAFATTALLFYLSLLLMGASEAILLDPLEFSTVLFFLFGFVGELERVRSREGQRSTVRAAFRQRPNASLVT